jgi:hypothetical protein
MCGISFTKFMIYIPGWRIGGFLYPRDAEYHTKCIDQVASLYT